MISNISNKTFIIISPDWFTCQYCTSAKTLLKENNIAHCVVEITQQQALDLRPILMDKYKIQLTFPQIFIADAVVDTYDNFLAVIDQLQHIGGYAACAAMLADYS